VFRFRAVSGKLPPVTADTRPQDAPGAGAPDPRDRPVGDLVEQLSTDVRELVRAEVAVARAELAESARRLAAAGGLAGFAAVCGLLALGALTATAILALDLVLPAWLAALVVAVVLALVGAAAVLGARAIARRAAPPTPAGTMESIREDIAWVKTRARSGAK
jgi:uncharacterized membrane protein YqjE